MSVNPKKLRPVIRTCRAEILSRLIGKGCSIVEARELAAKETRQVYTALTVEIVAANPGQEPRIRRVIRTSLGELCCPVTN